MKEILVRFLIGGVVVSIFAVLGDLFKPKSFAGLFGAAPSVALATILLTVRKSGTHYTAIEARSMLAGAIAFFVYSSAVSWVMMHKNCKALWTSAGFLVLWGAVAFGLWSVLLR
ncbi:MAG TPA: DUF3147 family protein [Candidatus Sulfotelmatobacter sp.]|nr:DUF3147 family protein [Candidatus Sulfotelmatobacter sp.]